MRELPSARATWVRTSGSRCVAKVVNGSRSTGSSQTAGKLEI